ncbi:hypothetical protein [Peribacillus asahii]|uniref:hypothetical protein n=1 Tax=Peribacillus asahii TaxID=228899 RepID=UPI00207A74A3|nr:hypothetical protein [Peribacillus asahii]USK60384.1 hypothetical protein LIT37_03260 [Peribacillus asahii]
MDSKDEKSYDYKHGFRIGYKQGYVTGLKLALMADSNAQLLLARESIQYLSLPEVVKICKISWEEVRNLVRDLTLPDFSAREFEGKQDMNEFEKMYIEGKFQNIEVVASRMFISEELPFIAEICKLPPALIKQMALTFIDKQELSNGEKTDKDREEEIEVQEHLDHEAFDVIKRLYDGTFKDLSNQ